MAIKIDIPGISGSVTVEGAAEERTMREILEALHVRNKQDGIQTKEVNESLKDLSNSAKEAGNGLKEVNSSSNSLSKSISGFGKSLASTAANIAVSFIKAYDTMAEKPIQAGAALVQAQIDLTAELEKLAVDAGSKLGQAILGLVPGWGDALQTSAEKFSQFSKDVIDLGAQFKTLSNQFLAAEFEKRIKALTDLTKAGASFGSGMTELGELANQSGIGLANYAKAIANSREAITAMGLSAGEAAKLVSKGYSGLNRTLGKSGNVLRDELLALGYSYEEQGEIMALFMAQQRRAGKNLENLAPAELAQGTAEYAKNLKVISDITGQDAKKIMERAQAESMRGALAGQLNKQQNEAFQGVFAGLSKIGPEMAPKLQLALTQLLSGKAIRDPAVAGNKAIMDMLLQSAELVRSGQVDQKQAFSQTFDNLIVAGEKIKSSGQDMTDVANAFGVTGVVADMANLNNAFRVMQGQVGEAGKSFKTATGQAEATDALTRGYQTATTELVNFQNQMEKIATDKLPEYAETLSKATKFAVDTMTLAIKYLQGEIGLSEIRELINSGESNRSVAEQVTNPTPSTSTSPLENQRLWNEKIGIAPFLNPSKNVSAERAELEAKHKKVQEEMYAVATARESTKEEREVHNKRIKELNQEAAQIVSAMQKLGPGKAKGGISEGPVSGYKEILHGTEAVVPLPDNKSIPVTLDSSSLTASLQQQNHLLSEILMSMNKNNNLTSGILQQSY